MNSIILDGTIHELKKSRILEVIAKAEKGLNEGASEELQLMDMFANSLKIF